MDMALKKSESVDGNHPSTLFGEENATRRGAHG
jgi:hypothetical protein